MKVGWIEKSLGDACELIARGIAPKYTDAGGLRVLNQKCIRDHAIDYSLARRHDVAARPVKAERLIRVGDVLVNSTGVGTLGRVAQVRTEPDEPTTVDTHVTIVRPRLGAFELDFFGHAMIRIEDEISQSGEGSSGQTELARSKLAGNFNISFPESKVEQRRIVAILDEAFAGISTAITNAERNCANARELSQTAVDSVFRSLSNEKPSAPLGELTELQSGFAFRSGEYVEDGHFLVRIGNVQQGFVSRTNPKFVRLDHKTIKFELRAGDILVSLTGNIGRAARISEADLPAALNQRVARLSVASEKLDPDYLFLFCSSRFFRDRLAAQGHGSAQQNVSPKQIRDIPMPHVSLARQRQTVGLLEGVMTQCEALVASYQSKLQMLAELKQSVLRKAFSGELGEKPQAVAA